MATTKAVYLLAFYKIVLKKRDSVSITLVEFKQADLSITLIPVPLPEANRNAFLLKDKTIRLPGHRFYFLERSKAK